MSFIEKVETLVQKPPLQPIPNPSDRRVSIEKHYDKIFSGKLHQLGKLLEKNAIEGTNEENLMKYMFDNDKKTPEKIKRSSSFREIERSNLGEPENIPETESPEKTQDQNISYKPLKIHAPEDDEMEKLDKLSLLNMGARYELLNTNKMMLDLDLELVFFLQ